MGSGRKGNGVVKSGQKSLERRKILWSPPLFIVPTAEAKISYVTVDHRTESRNIAVRHVSGKAVNIRRHMSIQKNIGKKSCEPMKREAVYEGLSEHLEYHVLESISWIKKSREAARAERNGART
jgi:hypothetical protein